MPRKPDTIETTLIVLELMRRIPVNRKISARDLHRQLQDIGIERDIRSIQRLRGFSLAHYDDSGRFGFSDGKRVRLSLQQSRTPNSSNSG